MSPALSAPASRALRFNTVVVLIVAVDCAAAFLVPLSVTELGASPGLLGLIMSVSSLGSLLAAVPAGLLVQRTGTRTPLIAACVASGVALAGIVARYSLVSIMVFFSLFRVAEIVIYVSFQEHVADLSGPGGDSTRDFGWYGFAASLGQLLGPAAAGVLLETSGYRWSWGVTAGSFIVTAVLVLPLVSAPPRAARDDPARASGDRTVGLLGTLSKGRWKEMLGPTGIVAIAASFIVIFAGGARGTYFPVYLTEIGFTPSVTGTLVAVGALASLLSRVFLTWLVRLCRGAFGAMLVSFAVMTVGMGITPLCRSLPMLAFNSFLVGIGGGVAIPLSMATVARSAPEGLRAVAISVRLTGNRLATLVNPLVFGLVSTLWGVPAAFVVSAAILLAATVALGQWWRTSGRAAGI